LNKRATRSLEPVSKFKFGSNNATVYTGKADSQPKSFWQKIDFMNAIVSFFILFISINIINSITLEFKLLRQTNVLQHEINQVKDEQYQLKTQIAFYKSPDGIEKLARERLGYIKVNEIPVRYIEKK
jgi:cell division protein FtsB